MYKQAEKITHTQTAFSIAALGTFTCLCGNGKGKKIVCSKKKKKKKMEAYSPPSALLLMTFSQ